MLPVDLAVFQTSRFEVPNTARSTGSIRDLTGAIPDLTGTIPDLTGSISDLTGAISDLIGAIPDFPGNVWDLGRPGNIDICLNGGKKYFTCN